ncbi:MAG TPA: MBL fold metallo-hydrolase [Thermoanaerobaculia bacterium]|nr:MBL fold metallo-hydrolase [Thermoanaerobaculia bacterium]
MAAERRERPFAATWAGLPLRGVSTAGRESWFHFPTLHLAFDVGRAPMELVPVAHLFLSHAHLDHAAGLAWWCSQRRLQRMPGGVARTHPDAVPLWREILSLHERLEGVSYDATVEAMPPGEPVSLRRDLVVASFSVDHRIPTLGFLASEVRRRLLPSFAGLGPAEVRAAAGRGEAVSREVAIPLVAYSGDTAAGFFDLAPPDVFRAKLLLLECSFVEERDEGRSREWKHLHLAEIAERADRFENEVLVLTHLTVRTTPDEIRREVKRRLPPRLAERTVPFLPE